MNNKLFRNVLVVGIIFLFLGIAVQPITSIDIKQNSNSNQVQKIEPLNNINPRKYLFETIILISNNPEIKELITKYKGKLFHWYQIWLRMRKITNKEIEKRAVMEIIDYFEPQIDAVIKQSIIELDKLNEYRVTQRLDPKIRIDKYCIENAIKTINSINDSPLPNKEGGLKKEKKDFNTYKTIFNLLIVT